MQYNPQNPIIVQGDKSVLLEVNNALYQEARDILSRFAELEKSPEYIHTYRISPLSLWNAASTGLDAETIVAGLSRYSKYPLPGNVEVDIREYVGRYGRIRLLRRDNDLLLTSHDIPLIIELQRRKELKPYILNPEDAQTLRVDPAKRGHIKQALVNIGYPAEDLAGYVSGDSVNFDLRLLAQSGSPFALRHYQQEAGEIFYADGEARGGSGVIVLPCGAGKTIVGLSVMNEMQCSTLILTPNTVSVRQWIDELLDKTTLTPEQVGEYSGQRKEIRPITISTYQTITYRKRNVSRTAPFQEQYPHFALFNDYNWGLIVYDEVHLLPAPVFSITADLQARRRLGLTATLVREDGRQEDVFSLIGPKKYDVPWKDLERQGWIATADVVEVRVPLPHETRIEYATADERQKYRIAAENKDKFRVLDELLVKHYKDQVLIIGMYLDQLEKVARRYNAPLITGKTSVRQRRDLYDQFKNGEISTLIVSKVGNFAVDLPNANVMVQISGMFGSRQEEAQRLGRILRPHGNSLAHFYTIVTKDTVDQQYGANRQLFLTEQGYQYTILYEDEVADYEPAVFNS
ncbi:MAG: DEAD/DEAH box helicase [Ardenticatenaceae bacterium]|nr:DEAD/DEAH box helicase [Ardenticatenaceae bacterium]